MSMAFLDVLRQENVFSLKKNIAARLRFMKLHLNKSEDFWNNVLWTDETKVQLFGCNVPHHV